MMWKKQFRFPCRNNREKRQICKISIGLMRNKRWLQKTETALANIWQILNKYRSKKQEHRTNRYGYQR